MRPFYRPGADPVIALWCFRGGPSLVELVRSRRGTLDRSRSGAT
ncbi:hypothetical protein AB0B89_12755 [Sphaerisporangium sp. NPDC049002]